MAAETSDIGALSIAHARGREVHPVTKAFWNLYRSDDNTPDFADTLHFYIEAGNGISNTDDYSQAMQPWWEICVIAPEIKPELANVGADFSVPLGWSAQQGGHVTNFYYFEHESTFGNRIEICETDGTKRLVKMTGKLEPKSQFWASDLPAREALVSVVAWFDFNPKSCRQTV